MFDDITSSALRTALTGLSMRQRVTANNISNIETPNFLAGKVEFEDALSSAISSGETPDAGAISEQRSLEPTRLNGSNVNLDHETLSNVDTGLRYDLMIKALDSKFGLLQSVIKG